MTDYVAQRTRAGRRTTPLISYNSIGWNRRHYEPIPDVSRPTSSSPYDARRPASTREGARRQQPFGSRGSPASRATPDDASLGQSYSNDSIKGVNGPIPVTSSSYREGYLDGSGGGGTYDPPRIYGIDTASRPPLVVHSPTKVYRPAWIGVSY